MGGVQLSVKGVCVIVGGVQGAISLSSRDKCCDWLQQLPRE